MKLPIFCLVTAINIFATCINWANAQSVTTNISANEIDNVIGKDQQLDCSDKIFLSITIEEKAQKASEIITIKWFNPAGDLQEKTELSANFIALNGKYISQPWAWMRLHRADYSSLFSFANPSIGLEEFIGDWKAEVFSSGRLIATQPFSVVC